MRERIKENYKGNALSEGRRKGTKRVLTSTPKGGKGKR